MSEPSPAGRVVLRFGSARAIGAAGVIALEDYARELTHARAAEALVAEDGTGLVGVVLEAPGVPAEGAVLEDIEAFARDLAERAEPRLGWS